MTYTFNCFDWLCCSYKRRDGLRETVLCKARVTKNLSLTSKRVQIKILIKRVESSCLYDVKEDQILNTRGCVWKIHILFIYGNPQPEKELCWALWYSRTQRLVVCFNCWPGWKGEGGMLSGWHCKCREFASLCAALPQDSKQSEGFSPVREQSRFYQDIFELLQSVCRFPSVVMTTGKLFG